MKAQSGIMKASDFRLFVTHICSSETTPQCWGDLAREQGCSGADGVIHHVGRTVASAVEKIETAVEATRAELQELKATLYAAVDRRMDVLSAELDTRATDALSSLGLQLSHADALVNHARAERQAVREAAAALCDADLVAHQAALTARLDNLEDQFQELPRVPVVSPRPFGITRSLLRSDTRSLLRSIASFGDLDLPRANAHALELLSIPPAATRGERIRGLDCAVLAAPVAGKRGRGETTADEDLDECG
jgi:hypothetical protein